MKLLAAVLLLSVAMPAAAEFTVVEETETMTVYREGDHVIVLLDTSSSTRKGVLEYVANTSREPFASTAITDTIAKRASGPLYWSRIRIFGSDLVCEKVAARPPAELRQHVLQVLAASPCRAGLL